LQFSVTFDNDQTLFAADLFANTIYMVTASGKVAPYVTIGGPEGLAFDRDGNLYVGGSGPPAGSGNITKIAPDGTQTTFASGFSEVRGLAFDSGGNLFVADKGAGVIYKITPNGTVSPFMSGFNMLQFLAFEP
jgi:sugar lactone lactonase YvrE